MNDKVENMVPEYIELTEVIIECYRKIGKKTAGPELPYILEV